MPSRERSVLTVTLSGRLLRTRGVAVYLLLALALPVLTFASLREAYLETHSVELDLIVDTRLRVDERSPRWPGVEVGDRFVAVAGHRVSSLAELVQRVRALPPGPVSLTFERAGREWVEEGRAELPPAFGRAVLWLRVGIGTALLVLGLLVFLLRPGGVVGWTFLLFCVSTGVLLLSRALLRDNLWTQLRVQGGAVLFAATLGLQLFSQFPRPVADLGRKRLFPLLHGLAVVVVGLRFLGGKNPDLDRALQGFISAWATGCAAMGVMVLFREHARARQEGEVVRWAQYRLLRQAALWGLLVPAVANAVRVLFQIGSEWVDLNAVPVGFFLATTGYALVRYNALELDRFTASVVGYAGAVLLLGTGFLGMLIALPLVLGAEWTSRPVVLIGLTAAFFFTVQPLYRALRRRVDRFFLRGAADESRRIGEALVATARAVQEGTREVALRAVVEAARAVRPDRSELWLLEADGKRFARAVADGAVAALASDVSREGALAQAVGRHESGGVEGLAPKALEAEAQREAWQLGLAMVAPVLAHGALAGFLGVGRALSGLAFRAEALSFLNVLATQAGLVLERGARDVSRVGRYRIERRLGVGGMAEVFLAWQLGPGGFERKVALKRPLPQLADDAQCAARFVDEARIAAGLHHRNIAEVYEVGQSEGGSFIALEYVDGPPLRMLLKLAEWHQRPVPLPVALALASALLKALGHAHALCDAAGQPMHVVHRDVSPSNVLLTQSGELKLVDFGIARATHQLHVTRTGTVAGTVPYMAPEHARGEEVSARSDLFSAGALIYELLTLRRAFPEGYQGQAPQRAFSLRPDLPLSLERFFQQALAERPEARFGSAEEMRRALLEATAPVQPAEEEAVAAWMRETLAFETQRWGEARTDEPTLPLKRPS